MYGGSAAWAAPLARDASGQALQHCTSVVFLGLTLLVPLFLVCYLAGFFFKCIFIYLCSGQSTVLLISLFTRKK